MSRTNLTAIVFVIASACALHGETPSLSVLYTFTGGPDGKSPSGVIENRSGDFFGTTALGGAPSCSHGRDDCGGVFELVSGTGAEFYLHVFATPSEGSGLESGVIQDPQGNLYGVATGGGDKTGGGVVYRLNAAGAETILHTFDRVQGFQEGWFPMGIIGDAAGNLYGSTYYGGSVICESTFEGCGVIFRIDSAGAYSALYSFTGPPTDGSRPNGPPIRDGAGNLYGTTFYGGPATVVNYGLGAGTVYKVDPRGVETIVYNFNGVTDGGSPTSGVIRDNAGNLYGVAQETGEGGGVSNNGVVYKLDTGGNLTVLYAFTGGADGGGPTGPLTLNPATGDLYGTAGYGGLHGGGVIFKVNSASGEETVLYSFTGLADGGEPQSAVILKSGANGDTYQLFGTTYVGGDNNACDGDGCGTIYQLTIPR